MGVLPKNENKGDDMLFIIQHLNQYVPCVPYMQEKVNSKEEIELEEKASFRKILIGGDQLTSARMRSGLKIKSNGQSESKKLLGIIPVVEDWHCKVNFLRVGLY